MIENNYNCEFELSFYQDVRTLSSLEKENKVKLVKHVETNTLYVMKTLPKSNLPVLNTIRNGRFFGVPKIKDIIEGDDCIYLIEEYVNGQTLERKLNEGLWDEHQVKMLAYNLCDILAQFHNLPEPIIHRDIKAANIIIDDWGNVCLLDFDISRFETPLAGRDTQLMGTPGYAAPEQYGFAASSPVTDIYALGVLMNKLLTDSFPSEGMYHGKFGKVIKRCIAMNPKDRYKSVRELQAALGVDSFGESFDAAPDAGWKIPGFRSNVLWKKVLAVIGYGFIVLLIIACINDTINATTAKDMHSNLSLGLLILLESFGNIFYIANYRGIRDAFPFGRVHGILELLRVAFTVCVYSIVVLIICALI